MKYLRNEKGIALVVSLLLMLVIMVIVLSVIYMVIQGTKTSGLQKRYQTARDAAYGGMEVSVKDILPRVISGSTLMSITSSDPTHITFATTTGQSSCFTTKTRFSSLYWQTSNATNCSEYSLSTSVKDYPDFTFTLSGLTGQANFVVYAKITDTISTLPAGLCASEPCTAGNSSTSSTLLEGEGVTATSTGITTPAHFPYLYRVDLQAERSTNPDERANLTGVYAY